MPAGQQLGVLAAFVELPDRLRERVRCDVLELREGSCLASWIACHTRIGLSGMLMKSTPSGLRASMTALVTAGEAAIVPASPIPLTPSELTGDGVTVRSVS